MKILNLGSGKDYRPDCVNVDINPYKKPDIVWNVCGQHLSNLLEPGSFDKILAYDVLEHLPNLIQAMTHCRDLLKEGGIMEILVPYDLSYGAWQDPSHVRAFNERSWIYYTEWAWYLDWKDWRFELDHMDYCLSEFGAELHKKEWPMDAVARLPRAVDALKIFLRKVKYDA